MNDINFVIMIEPGKLEWQGMMLIESIYENCEDSFAINVYCGVDKISRLSPVVLRYLEKRNININPINNMFQPYYPHGNKIVSSAMKRDKAKYGIFMDSDMLLLKKTRFCAELDKHLGDVFVVRAGLDRWSNSEADWLVAYSEVDVEPYPEKIKLADGRESYPYFNAGLVAFYEESGFASAWKDVAVELDLNDKISNKRPWLDQIALPIAIKKSGLKYSLLNPCFNYGLNNDYNQLSEAVVGHYHTKSWLYHHGLNNIMRRYTRESVGEKNFAVLVNKTEKRVS
ncbi:hypothetical protein F0A16_06565 [Salinicola corii]|uniref:Glycosyltransferase n=1 Tax=Salinicola corii TaxID=2606937 RepID=A0A640WFI0_9GAMM|nr:hypothetical protein [Salinicola corii]KAA0019014.1 hypothetical protein F0A16_06565 [Salinicola corii]